MNADGSESSGIILLKRPGRMRFEYDKPDKTLVLVAAGALAIFDPKGDQEPMTYPVRNNPISLLLNSEIESARPKSIKWGLGTKSPNQ